MYHNIVAHRARGVEAACLRWRGHRGIATRAAPRTNWRAPPSIMPRRPAENTRPSIIFDKPNSSRMKGAVKPTIIMSNPSNTVISQDRTTSW
jgi:hypothetical protein